MFQTAAMLAGIQDVPDLGNVVSEIKRDCCGPLYELQASGRSWPIVVGSRGQIGIRMHGLGAMRRDFVSACCAIQRGVPRVIATALLVAELAYLRLVGCLSLYLYCLSGDCENEGQVCGKYQRVHR